MILVWCERKGEQLRTVGQCHACMTALSPNHVL